MNPILSRNSLFRLRATLAALGLFLIALPPRADAQEKKESNPPGANATSTPNSARPIDSDGTPANPADKGTTATTGPEEPRFRNQSTSKELHAKITSGWIAGATIAREHFPLLVELPRPERAGETMRYRGGRVYFIDESDWRILRVSELDPGAPVAPEDSAFVAGYRVPPDRRSGFAALPAPEPRVTVRVYRGIAYYMDPRHRIVRVVALVAP